MTRTVRCRLLLLASALSVVACGSSGGKAPPDISVTSRSVSNATTPAPVPTTTAAAATTTTARAEATRGCLAVLADGLKLLRDYSQEVRGIAGADEAAYRARAQALVDEARRLGCRIPPGVEDFLQ